MAVTLADVDAARARIRSGILETPCNLSVSLSELTGCQVYAKQEYLQRTGSFKERGARNALLLLSPEERERGVVAASAGNHALALAFHGRDLGVPVTVVMPRFAPLIKQSRCHAMGARVLLSGDNIGEAKLEADKLVDAERLTYIHGFDGEAVIAGQGSVGLEVLEQVPDVDAIIVPIGGGGLVAGLGLAVKAIRPEVRIYGVETERSASFTEALRQGKPVKTAMEPTLADGLAVPTVGPNAFAIAREVVDGVVLVNEHQVAQAILRLVESEKGVVEGAGATPLSVLISNQLPELKGKKVVLMLCGGNIDPAVLGRVIDHGLVADGRLAQFKAVISDRPGGLAKLADTIAAAGASVQQIDHERAFASADVSTVEVIVTVETRDHDHIRRLLGEIRNAGIRVIGDISDVF